MTSTSESLGHESISAAILDAMPDAAVLVDNCGMIVFANARVEDLLGWSAGDLVGRSVDELVPSTGTNRHSSLRQRFADDPSTRPMGIGLDLNALRRDGTEIPVEISLGPLHVSGANFVIAAIRDGRPQREMRAALIEAGNHVASVINGLQDGVLEFDIEAGRYALANPRFCAMVGRSVEEVLAVTGTPPWWDPAEVEEIEALRTSAASGEIVRHEVGLRHSDGHRLCTLATSSVAKRGNRTMLICLFHDLTDEKRAAEQLEASRSHVALLEDRDRIARDLHDGVIQRLFAAGLHLQAAVGRGEPDARILAVIDEIDESIKQIRTTIFTLQGQRGLSTGLEHGLRVAVAESSRLLGHSPVLRLHNGIESVPEELGGEILTVVRELLTNIVKHAHASSSFVDLSVENGILQLQVRDDGVGIRHEPVPAGSGLKNLEERALRRGGLSSATTNEPSGTTITWQVPLL